MNLQKEQAAGMRVSEVPFGFAGPGKPARLFTLVNNKGMVVRISSFGGIITEIHVPDRHGQFADVTLGFGELAPYLAAPPYFGALIGRYGNRIAKGRFVLDGHAYQLSVNNGENHLHGGAIGFDKVVWDAEAFQTAGTVGVRLSYLSVDGEQGYPGNLQASVQYELSDNDELMMAFGAVTDKATPVNLTNHAYFNLAGQGDILGHELTIAAQAYTEIGATLIPTGVLAPVAGTPFDFRTPHAIGERIGEAHPQLANGSGYDHNFALDSGASASEFRGAVHVREPVSGRVLELFTQEPGVQFYSGNFLDGMLSGKGRSFGHRSGFCLEPQHFPDSPNQAAFPSTILRPGEQYSTRSSYRFSVAP
jgi:aldose 1-epimerase